MNKDMFKGILGLLALGVYGGKFIYALIALPDYKQAVTVLLVGMVIEFVAFLYVMSDL